MNTRQYARGFVGALSLLGVIGAVGCGAQGYDEGAAGEGEIGSVDQALAVPAAVNGLETIDLDAVTGGIQSPGGREWQASCLLNGRMIVYGGYDSTGAGKDETFAYNAGTNAWAILPKIADSVANGGLATANQGRGQAKFVQVSATECMLTGGLSAKSGGALRPNVYSLSFAGSAFTWSTKGTLVAGRVQHQAFKCSTNDVVVIGGHTASGPGTLVGTNVEHFNGGTWAALTVTGLPVVHSAAFAAKSDTEFLYAGGFVPSSPADATVNPLIATVSNNLCTALSIIKNNNVPKTSALRDEADANDQGRFGAVALYDSTNNRFVVVTGDDAAGALPTHGESYSVTFSTTVGAITHNAALFPSTGSGSTAPMQGVRYAQIAFGSKIGLFGGEDRSSATPLAATPLNIAQDLSLTATRGTDRTLTDERLGAAVQFVSGSTKFIAVAGRDATPAVLESAESIAP